MSSEILQAIEAFYDAVPRQGSRVEPFGPLTLFVRQGAGWPFYARPTPRGGAIDVATVGRVLDRQRELGVPQAFEWLDDLTPTMGAAAHAAGLVVQRCPLLVLDSLVVPAVEADLRVLGGDEPDLARVESVAHVAFGAAGTHVGTAGPAERDAEAASRSPDAVAALRLRLLDGSAARVAAYEVAADTGPVGVGGYQHARGVAEIVGVATLPAVRRRGIGAAVTARLAQLAIDRGMHTVFLSAQDDDVARVYERIGFRRVATAGLAEPPPW